MDMMSIGRSLLKVVANSPLLYCQLTPEILNFTIHESGIIRLHGTEGSADIPFSKAHAVEAISLLEHAIGDRVVLCWGFKELATLVRFYTRKSVAWAGQVRDLAVIERFLGIRAGKAPGSLSDALTRIKALDLSSWRELYRTVHLPLMAEVVPEMEAHGLGSYSRRCLVHPYYEIEGQTHGRMRAIDPFTSSGGRGYNPHTMGASPDMHPLDGEQFLVMDYKNMEVTMLAWLAKDKTLQAILNSGRDVYETIWLLLDQKLDGQSRQTCKEIFIGVIYGMGEKAIAEKLCSLSGNPESVEHENRSHEIIGKIYERFSSSMHYLRNGQDSTAPNGLVLDHFGRPRVFDRGSHKIRNFLIQSPAAIVCEERLVALHRAINGVASLAFHVHDGYAMTCKKSDCEHAFTIAKETLEAESPLCPGLKLKCTGQVGERLDQLVLPV